MKATLIALLLSAAPAFAQEAAVAPGGTLRWLDKVTGATGDLELSNGQSLTQGFLTIRLDECRYPVADPASDAFAHVTIQDSRANAPNFSGWMIASSPAISALDHPRYDVWVLSCAAG
ncbi:DUF2155 domain-containing protein [Cereibacter sp. SYSU M97828]|nr:DUF2155 domain-containing protein [Cereibacter flavus]